MANIFIYSSNAIGKSMAGPAIRSWEFAKELAKNHNVTLISPNQPDIEGIGFKILLRSHLKSQKNAFDKADVLITQGLTCSLAVRAKLHGVKIIIDAYDPMPLESLEQFKSKEMSERIEKQFSSINQLLFNFKMADGIICASEKQRDLWIGFLLAHKLLTPSRYDKDNSLRDFLDVVPFGLPKEEPKKTSAGLREKYELKPEDKILLWGGGIWNWFDPLTLIEAFDLLKSSHPYLKLIFMGIKNPEPSVPEMEMGYKAISLAEKLGLINKTVFFNHGWIPYEERQNHLLDATLGVSIHFDHLETRYSFRTRMLDYIWAELPILATEGDSFAELIDQKQLGKVVPYKNPKILAECIQSLTEDKQELERCKKNLKTLKNVFYWSTVIEPIQKMVQGYIGQPRKRLSLQDFLTLSSFIISQLKEKGFKKSCDLLLNKWRAHA